MIRSGGLTARGSSRAAGSLESRCLLRRAAPYLVAGGAGGMDLTVLTRTRSSTSSRRVAIRPAPVAESSSSRGIMVRP